MLSIKDVGMAAVRDGMVKIITKMSSKFLLITGLNI